MFLFLSLFFSRCQDCTIGSRPTASWFHFLSRPQSLLLIQLPRRQMLSATMFWLTAMVNICSCNETLCESSCKTKLIQETGLVKGWVWLKFGGKKEIRGLNLASKKQQQKQSSLSLRLSLLRPCSLDIPHTSVSTYKAPFHSSFLVYHVSTVNVASMISTHLDCWWTPRLSFAWARPPAAAQRGGTQPGSLASPFQMASLPSGC